MTSPRKSYSAEFKAKVALEAVKGNRTINEIASSHGLHPNQLTLWKKQLMDELPVIFSDKRSKAEISKAEISKAEISKAEISKAEISKAERKDEEKEAQLYQQIGQLKVEVDWLKKKSGIAT